MRFDRRTSLLINLLLTAPTLSAAFYLPGVAPTSYDDGQSVPLYVNHLTPGIAQQDEQLHSVFSYDYYHPAFQFCVPENGPKDVRESLGSILFGDRIQTSSLELSMRKDETCKAACQEATFDSRSATFTNQKIGQGYNINWLVDGLPAAQQNLGNEPQAYSPGFALGELDEAERPVLHNHFDILVDYHPVNVGNKQKYRVIGVLVQPSPAAARGSPRMERQRAMKATQFIWTTMTRRRLHGLTVSAGGSHPPRGQLDGTSI